jgi:threonine dehydrogenase-like Zn-dependent dehydrogenase
MKALYLEDSDIRIKDVKIPVSTKHAALVKVLKAGICNTDIELIKGYMNFSGILGHEFVGQVVESPEPSWIGKRVVGEINLSCGTCDFCQKGESRHCSSRDVLGISGWDGVFAEYVTLPLKNLHLVPDSITDVEAVFVEPLAAACEILEQIEIDKGMSVAVLGDGKLGLLIAQVMRLKTSDVTCFGRHDIKLERLRNKGIRIFKNGDKKKEVYDVVIEATGSTSGIEHALEVVRPKGSIVLKSTVYGKVDVDLSKIVVSELVLIGSRCGPFDKALGLLEKKSVDVEHLVDREFPLEQGIQALTFAANPDVVKVLLAP